MHILHSKYIIASFFLVFLLFSSCGDDDMVPPGGNEEEIITSVILTFLPPSGVPVFASAEDPDGRGAARFGYSHEY